MSSVFPWSVVPLEDLAEQIDYGLTASATDSGNGPKFLRITDIQDDRVDWATVPLCSCTIENREKYALKAGDIVFARTGATTGKSFLVRSCPLGAVFASYLIRVRPSANVDSGYLARYFQTPDYWRYVTRSSTGTAQAGVNASNLKKLPVPLPPLEEQRRIAAILDKADAVRRKRQQAIALTEELLRSAFLEMFGDPDTNPKGWEMKPLGEVCSRVTVGFVGTMALEYIEEGIPWLRSLNVKRNRITLNDLKYVSTNFHERVIKSSLSPGDVVAVRTGNAGVAAVVPTSISHANCADLIVMTCGSELVPTYLSETLNLLLGDRDGGTGLTGAIQKHFNIARAKQLMIPLPPLHDQENWATLVNQLERLQLTQEKDKEETHALFNSLLQRAFQGEL